ncbi:MAG: 1-deoxy-D-xylulose-5-phosphate reductoisomerase, partial [Eubacteriales bacterium]
MNKKVTVLGSTGSIGIQALEVARLRGFDVIALAAHSNVGIIEAQIREFKPQIAAMMDQNAAEELKIKVGDTATKILSGIEGVCECARLSVDTVLNSIVGMAGLMPTLAAIEAGNEIALA